MPAGGIKALVFLGGSFVPQYVFAYLSGLRLRERPPPSAAASVGIGTFITFLVISMGIGYRQYNGNLINTVIGRLIDTCFNPVDLLVSHRVCLRYR